MTLRTPAPPCGAHVDRERERERCCHKPYVSLRMHTVVPHPRALILGDPLAYDEFRRSSLRFWCSAFSRAMPAPRHRSVQGRGPDDRRRRANGVCGHRVDRRPRRGPVAAQPPALRRCQRGLRNPLGDRLRRLVALGRGLGGRMRGATTSSSSCALIGFSSTSSVCSSCCCL